MSNLCATVRRLRQQALAAPRQDFREGRLRQPLLADYPDVSSVFTALADQQEETYPARDALTRALLAEYQESRKPLWASILLVAYYPMLSHLRRRVIKNPIPPSEIDQVLMMAFLTILAEFPLATHSDRVPMRLRQGTRRWVFKHLRKERVHRPHAMPEEDDDEPEDSNRPPRPQRPLASPEEEELLDLSLLLRRAARTGYSQESLEVVSATVLQREPLSHYVARIAPKDELKHRLLYERLKRRRSRTLLHFRKLAEVSPLSPRQRLLRRLE